MRIAFFLFFSCVTAGVKAQEEVVIPETEAKDSIRSIYIQDFPDHFFIYPVLKQRSLSFELEKNDGQGLLTYKPNNTFSVGVGLYIFELGAELTFAVPLDELSREIYGESDARDLQLSMLGKAWGLDAFYQKYSGFYLTERGNEPGDGAPFPQRRDVVSRSYGLTGNYVFNHRKFSFRSFYNYAERQLMSSGSFLVSAIISRFKVSGDSSILDPAQELVFGPEASFRELRYGTFSIAPGYTYSIIYRNFFLNGSLSAGPAHHWIRYRLESGQAKDDIAVNSFVAARIGIGYNGNRVFGGIGFLTRGSAVKFERVAFSDNNGSFKILVGYRFREKGLLRKKAWDLIPFDI